MRKNYKKQVQNLRKEVEAKENQFSGK